jgi:putative transposase
LRRHPERGWDAVIFAALKHELAASVRRRFGHRRLHILLKCEGIVINHKKVRRLYREEHLQVRRRGGRKRALRTLAPLVVQHGPDQRRSLDFPADATIFGRRFRILAIVDDFTRECLALVADISLPGLCVARELDAVTAIRSCPKMIVSDRGHRRVESEQNAFIESFNGRLRDELLNETLFSSLAHARTALSLWKDDYNTVRPHSGLGNLTPADYADRSAPDPQTGRNAWREFGCSGSREKINRNSVTVYMLSALTHKPTGYFGA